MKQKYLFSVALTMILILAVVSSSLAVHDDNLFELGPAQNADILGDGNASNGPDWADVFDGNGSVIDLFGGAAASFIIDQLSQASAVDQSTFSGAGGSNKNNDPVSNADCAARTPPLTGSACDTWHWDTGNVPAKDDLSNIYAYSKMNLVDGENHLIVYSGFERLDPSGDSHIDIEFFQDQVSLDEDAPCNDPGPDGTPCGFTGIRTIGDLIVSMDFTTGGALGEVSIHSWDGSEYLLVETIGGEGCDANDTACAFNNGVDIDGGPWPNYNRHGALITSLPANAFTEFGVDVTALIGGTPCFTTFMGKTRSSQSFTAELKDFAGPGSLPICGAAITIGSDATNEVGQNHTFTVNVFQSIGGVQSPAPDGTIVDVTLAATNGADVQTISDNCISPGTVAGSCTVTFTSDSAGLVTGHASADVTFGGHTFHVETNGLNGNSGDALKTFVDAYITIGPDDTNSIGESHTFTVVVQQDVGDGAGFVDVPDGTLVTVTLSPAASVVDLVDDCGTTGTVGGECDVTFTSNTEGTITGHAAVSLTIGTVTLNRETDASGSNSDDAVKNFVDGSLSWLKHDNAGRLLGGATFQVCRTHDRHGVDIADECVNVTDGSSPDADADAGEFLLMGLPLGRYTVVETIAPPGYEADPDTVTVELTLAAPDGSIAIAFVNPRPIVKLSEFGYVNAPTGTPTDGVVSGTTTYTIKLKNFGGASATDLSGTLDVVTDSVGGTLSCPDAPVDISGSLAPGAELTFTLTCTYTGLDDGSVVTASLSAVDYTLNGLARTASGTPAWIAFTIQSD